MPANELIILGSGPAGWTAAIYAARAGLSPTVLTGVSPGGQLMTTTDVDNWPAEDAGVQGPALMERFERHAKRFDTQIIHDHIAQVDFSNTPLRLFGDSGSYTCRALIIATGANAKYLGLSSEQRYRGRGVSACATCDGFFYRDKDVAVIGGGNTAVEEALHLSSLASSVTLIHRRDRLRAESILQQRLFDRVDNGNVRLITSAQLEEVIGDDNGVTGIRVKHNDGKSSELNVAGVFIAIGHTPNTALFKNALDMEDGYIVVRGGTHGMASATSADGVFAAGDVHDNVYRQAITSAAAGCIAALDAKSYLDLHDG